MTKENQFNESKQNDSKNKLRGNRIALYVCSVSTDGRYSSMQEQRLRDKVATLNRYRHLGEIVEVFKDHGMLFDLSSRPALQALLHAVLRKQVTLVMVPEFRDLSSSPGDLFKLLQFFDKHRCGLRSLHEYLLFEDLGEDDPAPKSS